MYLFRKESISRRQASWSPAVEDQNQPFSPSRNKSLPLEAHTKTAPPNVPFAKNSEVCANLCLH